MPQPIGGDVVDQAAAVRLGKALFWDVQAGSDGRQACATCHFHAGTDARRVDILHPGPNGIFETGGVTSAGQLLPAVNIASDDRAGSSGVLDTTFRAIPDDPRVAAEVCDANVDPVFGASRQVTARNAPSVVGAVFNRDNFWDGRANHRFNGHDPFGAATQPGGPFVENASLASQATGPALSSVEMSCAGRTFNGPNSLGAKLMARPPLQLQLVSPTDSVLGPVSAWPLPGLTVTYADLVAAAFGPGAVAGAVDRFSTLWGQAVQAYESTLVPDRTPLDRFLAGDGSALTPLQQRGLDVFKGKADCARCHAGAELTDASASFAALHGLVNEDGGDQGFHNLGVRPTAEDLGRGGSAGGARLSVSGAAADRGAFKTPGLRNVALTAPYFHNGGKATLADVVDFYDRGGDFPNPEKARRIQRLGLSIDDKAALVEFLENGLTDCRAAAEAAPFDHPSLDLPNGPSLAEVGAAGTMGCP